MVVALYVGRRVGRGSSVAALRLVSRDPGSFMPARRLPRSLTRRNVRPSGESHHDHATLAAALAPADGLAGRSGARICKRPNVARARSAARAARLEKAVQKFLTDSDEAATRHGSRQATTHARQRTWFRGSLDVRSDPCGARNGRPCLNTFRVDADCPGEVGGDLLQRLMTSDFEGEYGDVVADFAAHPAWVDE